MGSMYRFIKKIGDRPFIYIPISYLGRFLRLTPIMMFVMLIWMTLQDQLSYGYHVTSRTANHDACAENWYKILFFYANLTDDPTGQCVGWFWYLQCDMQMFLVLPFLLWIFTKSKISGIISSLIMVMISVIIRLVYGFHYEFTANRIFPAYGTANDGDENKDSYTKPWTWMAAYFLAVALAMWMKIIRNLCSRHGSIGRVC